MSFTIRLSTSHRGLFFSALLCAAACGDDSPESSPPPAQSADASAVTGDDASVPFDAGSTGPVIGLDAGARDAGSTTIDVIGADASTSKDGGVVTIPIPKRTVQCGNDPCDVKNNVVCCETWSKEEGFGKSTCEAQATCTSSHSTSGATNRMVTSVCDDAADCSGGQVCCYVRITTGTLGASQPLCDGFLGTCGDINAFIGPGASRVCLDIEDCNSANPPYFGTAKVSCTSDADCKDVGGTCQPEVADAQPKPVGTVASTKNPRPYAKVCR